MKDENYYGTMKVEMEIETEFSDLNKNNKAV